MGRVKQALIEVDDLVCGCLQQGRTLNQTVRDLEEIFNLIHSAFRGGAESDLV